MKILILGPCFSTISKFLVQQGYSVKEWCEPIDKVFLKKMHIDFVISYRYRYLIREEVIGYLKGNIINLHISYLPWNRGADPNLWSFLEDTPKGVSIHYVDSGIDTGDIIVQEAVTFDENEETLASSYKALNIKIVRLFEQGWELIALGKAPRIIQEGNGTFHRLKDKEQYKYLLAEKGWDTPVLDIKGKALSTMSGYATKNKIGIEYD